MPGSSNTSFIPKKSGVQRDHQAGARQVYVGTLIVRILFVASLLAVAGVYAYQYKLEGDLDAQIVLFNTAIAGFNDAEMQRVVSLDKRLSQVSNIMAHTLSVTSLLKAVEESTVESVQITQFSVLRDANDLIEISADLDTGSFDSALFQKNILEKSDTLSVLEVSNLKFTSPETEEVEGEIVSSGEKRITFKARLAIDIAKIPHTVGDSITTTPVATSSVETATTSVIGDTAAQSGLVESNQEEI